MRVVLVESKAFEKSDRCPIRDGLLAKGRRGLGRCVCDAAAAASRPRPGVMMLICTIMWYKVYLFPVKRITLLTPQCRVARDGTIDFLSRGEMDDPPCLLLHAAAAAAAGHPSQTGRAAVVSGACVWPAAAAP